MIDIMWIIWFVLWLPLHEFGHYLMARKLGWGPKVCFKRDGLGSGLAVLCKSVNVNIETEKDVVDLHYALSALAISGCVFPTVLGVIFSFFAPSFFMWNLILAQVLCSITELFTGISIKKEGGNSQEHNCD